MASQNFMGNVMASFPQLVEENLSMLEETYEGTDLHLATQLGDEVRARKLLELCPSLVSSTNSNGDTPLHLAASLGHTSILIWMLESIELDNACETKTLDDPKPAEMMNKDGLTPLHCAAIKGSVEILREFLNKVPFSFYSVTLEKKETVFHLAARHKNDEAFIFMAKSDNLGLLLYQLDVEGNTVLHVAAAVGSISLVKYIIAETKIDVTTKNKKGFEAVGFHNKDDGDFLQLSTALMMCPPEIFPSSRRKRVDFEIQEAHSKRLLEEQRKILRVESRDANKKFKMQLEALQSARNTLAIVAVLIASVTFTCGINPPGGVYQEKAGSIGKSTAGKTIAFLIFSVSNSIALFTSVGMVILLVSFIPYREDTLLKFVIIAHWMMRVAVATMTSAYVSAAWIILPHDGETKWLLYATLAIAIVTLGGMFIYLRFKWAKCSLRTSEFLQSLSTVRVRTNGCVDMAANIKKGYYSYC